MTQSILSISPPGVDATTASNANLLLNSEDPLYKIDTQNKNGFRTTSLNFLHDPPEGVGSAFGFTVVYQYPHNYTYIPAIQALFFAKVPPTGTGFTQQYFFDSGVIASHTVADGAFLFAYADATNIYIVCRKFCISGSGGLPNNLTGAFYEITIYAPVEDIGV